MADTTSLTKEEREVHIYLDDIDRIWTAEVSIPKYINKFRKSGWTVTRELTDENGNVVVALFKAKDKESGISIRTPVKRKVELTEEQLSALKQRMNKSTNREESEVD